MRLLPELYRSRTVAALLHDAVGLVAPLIPSDGCGWFVFEVQPVPVLVGWAETEPILAPVFTPEMAPRWGEAVSRHPFIGLWATEARPSPVMYSDVSRKGLDSFLGEYWEMYRDVGDDSLTIPVTVTPTCAGALSFRRVGRRFAEDHRALASLLQPHLSQAYANAQSFSAMTTGNSPPALAFADGLTERESDVAFWLTQGKTNFEIGVILNIRARTVEKHVEHLLRKLHVENRVSAALLLAGGFTTKGAEARAASASSGRTSAQAAGNPRPARNSHRTGS